MSLESHNQWGRPGPQGAAMGSSGEEAEGEGNSLISQTVAMAIAGTSTPTPMSRPSSFLLNAQVRLHNLQLIKGTILLLVIVTKFFTMFFAPGWLLVVHLSRLLVSTGPSRPSQVVVCSSVCCGCWRMLTSWCYRSGSQTCRCPSSTASWISFTSASPALSTR